ncbi:EscE/YscE/SsaE family type III secretion system needle protein co-chaperone [Aureimonas leprariae]|uniref:Uncharacterized protein n=1 Tax=Plantimonas leprariae TaxID=2615207 RepID=A0A7V7PLA8_9HYPH|nr:EscE/YscE/SsaE family type III secretion system needle protein co-chaperone [Aureimonas leprariae]KAB0676838.1 hypothetical protein F6X38_19905 [Aureimonas leprariae]
MIGRPDQPPQLDPEEGTRRALMTDLSEALAGPDGPTVAAELMARLDRVAEELTLEMTNGTAPDRFRSIEVLREGIRSARSVLVAVSRPAESNG